MKTRYLSNPDYNFEKVNRASMACGPMVKWAIAQVRSILGLYYFIIISPLHSTMGLRPLLIIIIIIIYNLKFKSNNVKFYLNNN